MPPSIDPKPRAPVINYETQDWTEEDIIDTVLKEMDKLRNEGFNYILIGSPDSWMLYAWLFASKYQLGVVTAKTINSSDGESLIGYTYLPIPAQAYNYTWLGSLE